MNSRPLHVLVLSDANTGNLVSALRQDRARPSLEPIAGTFGAIEVVPALRAASRDVDAVVMWTHPTAISAAVSAGIGGDLIDSEQVLADVDRFADQLEAGRGRGVRFIVFTWSVPRVAHVFPSASMASGGLASAVLRMNLRLIERAADMAWVTVLDGTGLSAPVRTADEAKLWYAAKVPFGADGCKRAARLVKSTLRAGRGLARKVIALDLDHTLWGGVVGEVGINGLRLGGHDPTGEAYRDFQTHLAALARRGILLVLVSKNDATTALDAIDGHPEMVLRRGHFSGWRINWDDKAANLVALAADLNLGLDAFVFIDDHPAERARVRETLPEVFVPEWPASPLLYVDALVALDCFDTLGVTSEDAARTALYAGERARSDDRRAAESAEQWLTTLGLRVDVEEFHPRNARRTVQLLNKTNQLNLSTRRLDEPTLLAWLAGGCRKLWTYRVSDRFGDAGLTGVASVDVSGRRATLVDFVLSCRVFGRQVEHAMLHTATAWAQAQGAAALHAEFVPTAKNGPCLTFLAGSGMVESAPQRFEWVLASPYPSPPHVELRQEESSIA